MDNKKEIKTGFFELDNIINANDREGKLIAIASRPGMGKSTFVLNLLSNIVTLNDGKVLLFSLEMGKENIEKRIKASGLLIEDEFKRIYIEDTPKIDIDYIEKFISKYDNLSAVFIDYIQLVNGFKYSCERESILNQLKRICKEKNIHIIYAQQLSRNLEKRIDKRPVLFNVDKCSEKIADSIFALYRSPYRITEFDELHEIDKPDITKLIVLKNSFGELFELYLKFNRGSLTYSYDYKEITTNEN